VVSRNNLHRRWLLRKAVRLPVQIPRLYRLLWPAVVIVVNVSTAVEVRNAGQDNTAVRFFGFRHQLVIRIILSPITRGRGQLKNMRIGTLL
jgi:hypothetical protein